MTGRLRGPSLGGRRSTHAEDGPREETRDTGRQRTKKKTRTPDEDEASDETPSDCPPERRKDKNEAGKKEDERQMTTPGREERVEDKSVLPVKETLETG